MILLVWPIIGKKGALQYFVKIFSIEVIRVACSALMAILLWSRETIWLRIENA